MYNNLSNKEKNILNITLSLIISLIIFVFYFRRISIDNIIYFLIITIIFYIILNLLTKKISLEGFQGSDINDYAELFYGNSNLTKDDSKLLSSLTNLFNDINKSNITTSEDSNTSNKTSNKINNKSNYITSEEHHKSPFKSTSAKLRHMGYSEEEEHRRYRRHMLTEEEHHIKMIPTEEEYKYKKYTPMEEEHKVHKTVAEEEEHKPSIAPYIMNNPTNVPDNKKMKKAEETPYKKDVNLTNAKPNETVPLSLNGASGTPININISYNAQNSVNENNVGRESKSVDSGSGSSSGTGTANSNKNSICDRNNYYNSDDTRVNYNNSWMYGKWAWNDKPDYYIPTDNNVKYNIKQIPTESKKCTVCPAMANTPWSNYLSGDDNLKK
jgi:hypothetical protein